MRRIDDDPRIRRGMAAQLDARRLRLEAGERPLGWKLGFGSKQAMERLGTGHPLVGFLTDGAVLPSGSTISIARWTHAVAEPAVAVYMGRDLPAGADLDRARAAVAAVGPAIELADLEFAPTDVEAILAGNIYQRRVVLGLADKNRAGGDLDGLVGHVYQNGAEIAATTNPQAITGDLLDNVRHVAELLASVGLILRAGEVVITGSIVPPIEVGEKTVIGYTLEPIDTLTVVFDR